MLGTFAGALDGRKINAKEGRLTAEVRGEVEEENKVLIIRRVHVTFHLRTVIPTKYAKPWIACTTYMRKGVPCTAR